MPKVGLVHIDVDLYSSTVEVLEFVKPLLVKSSVLVFDDWYCFPPGSEKESLAQWTNLKRNILVLKLRSGNLTQPYFWQIFFCKEFTVKLIYKEVQ